MKYLRFEEEDEDEEEAMKRSNEKLGMNLKTSRFLNGCLYLIFTCIWRISSRDAPRLQSHLSSVSKANMFCHISF